MPNPNLGQALMGSTAPEYDMAPGGMQFSTPQAMPQQKQPEGNPFAGLEKMVEMLDKDPERAMQQFRFLAKNGIKPPPFQDSESLLKHVEDMFQGLSQSSQANLATKNKAMQGPAVGAQPIMPEPKSLGQYLGGGLQ